MWSPTHLVVTVLKAKGLLIKGKNGTNNCFVTIALGKEKFQTTVQDKSSSDVVWHEECELSIPSQGNRAELILTVLHRNKLGLDEFLGQVIFPLCDLDVYETPKSKWLRLSGKPGKENKKERGELEVRISFTVKAGSLIDLSKVGKNKSSTSLANIGGSLLSLSTLDKRKKIKEFTKSLGNKSIFKRNSKGRSSTENESPGLSSRSSLHSYSNERCDSYAESTHDPGIISENEDEFIFETLSQKGSSSSLSFTKENALNKQNQTLPKYPSKQVDEWQQKLTGKRMDPQKPLDAGSQSSLKSMNDSPKNKKDPNKKSPRISIEDSENVKNNREIEKLEKKTSPLSLQLSKIGFSSGKNKVNELKNEIHHQEKETNTQKPTELIIKKYEGLTRDELMIHAFNLENDLSSQKQKIKELEDYLDLLLLRVMEREPRILQNPYAKVNPTKSG